MLPSKCRVVILGGIVPAMVLILTDLAQAEAPPVGPLAHFSFNGHTRDENPKRSEFEVWNTEFQDDALFLNGVYEFGPDAKGYHAICRTPALKFTAFSVSIRFNAKEYSRDKSMIFVGGPSYRWFGLERSEAGNLTIALNNRLFQHEIAEAPLKAGRWTLISCGVDLATKQVVANVDGKKVAGFQLPDDFKLAVIGSKDEANDKAWLFANYSNANVFHGSIDELVIHNRLLTPDEFEQEFRRIPRKHTDADSIADKDASNAKTLSAVEREVLDLTNRERAKVGLPPLKIHNQLLDLARGHVTNMAKQEIINHELDGKTFLDRIKASGYDYSSAGENIQTASTAAEAIEGWMKSPGHQQNILNKDYTEIGVGQATSKSMKKYWTQVFGAPLNRKSASPVVDPPRKE